MAVRLRGCTDGRIAGNRMICTAISLAGQFQKTQILSRTDRQLRG
jgi:hypothetical protein